MIETDRWGKPKERAKLPEIRHRNDIETSKEDSACLARFEETDEIDFGSDLP
jgi:hypothetical protein